ncbi:hypothetical protein DYB37_003003 [Aphanomyces astaci]|uniref:Uncharacterized protein n=1 Tax=Aphanomyces astaci TaxID=112090 RepID=A0A3R7BA86_APHAT|nr:hypothetical protein DYB37_003003 [Aphanomyces astaci]
MVDHQIQWDREQAKKTKQREMEQTTVAYEEQNRQDKDQLTKVTQHLRDVTMSHANELEKLHAAQESAKEERTVKEALQHQISTLHQVNDALQKRCDALVRRLQLNSNCMSEVRLKSQLEELEAQHEILAKAVRMRDAKQSHYQDMEALKAALYESQSAAHEAEKRALELQGELTAVRVQNNTMSEYMMYGPKRVQPIAAIGSDNHSILRALKNRNKQLQERLQQEADATFQLEEEINMITSSYHTLLNPHD